LIGSVDHGVWRNWVGSSGFVSHMECQRGNMKEDLTQLALGWNYVSCVNLYLITSVFETWEVSSQLQIRSYA
jgi:hypothetical protein